MYRLKKAMINTSNTIIGTNTDTESYWYTSRDITKNILLNRVKHLITQKDNEADYDGKAYIMIKINSDDNLLLNKSLFLTNVMIPIRSVFEDASTYCPQVFLK